GRKFGAIYKEAIPESRDLAIVTIVGEAFEASGKLRHVRDRGLQLQGHDGGEHHWPNDAGKLPRLTSESSRRAACQWRRRQCDRADAIKQQAQQEFRGQPGLDRVVAIVREAVEVTQGLPA